MFWHKVTKDDMDRAKEVASEVRHGKKQFLSVLYQMLVSRDKHVVRYAASEIAQYMQGLDSARIIKLDENFRQYSSMVWNINWQKVDFGLWKKCIECREDYLCVPRSWWSVCPILPR